jgi:hypothetical protein
MSLARIVLDNSAIIPAYFPQASSPNFDAGLVTNRARALVHAVRLRRVDAFVPPSFFREFLNVVTTPLYQPGGWASRFADEIRAHWEDLLSLPLIHIPVEEILHHSGILAFEDHCPSADTWYVAAAVHASATLWMSHEHKDGLFTIANRLVNVRLLSNESPGY